MDAEAYETVQKEKSSPPPLVEGAVVLSLRLKKTETRFSSFMKRGIKIHISLLVYVLIMSFGA